MSLAIVAAAAAHAQVKLDFSNSALAAGASSGTAAAESASHTLRTDAVSARLVAHAPEGWSVGRTVWLGVELTHSAHWHTYWKNAGDSGLPTTVQWTLPAGLHIESSADVNANALTEHDALLWPAPHSINTAGLMSYGHEGTVTLLARARVGTEFESQPHASARVVQARVQWLACKLECIPEGGTLSLELPSASPLREPSVERAIAHMPQTLPQAQALLKLDSTGADATAQLHIQGLPAALHGRRLAVWPEHAELFQTQPLSPLPQQTAHALWSSSWSDTPSPSVQLRLPLSELRSAAPERVAFIVAEWPASTPSDAQAHSHTTAAPTSSWRVLASVQGAWPQTPSTGDEPLPAALAAALATQPQPNAVESTSPSADATTASQTSLTYPKTAQSPPWGMEAEQANTPALPHTNAALWTVLLGAMLGGALLNLMPCVFPVLAIKVLGFAAHGADGRAQRLNAWAYAAGVVLSFVLLGGVLLALRAAGQQLGWGFQLQQPWVVLALAALFVLIALNLLGVFEFGQATPGALAGLRLRNATCDSFLSGVLAVAVASPCTAPFMGASLGLTAVLPSAHALAVFAALGVGMAAPYVLLAHVDVLARALPRPGAWMQTFKQAMAFPMFAAAVWLLWVLGQQSGVDAVATALVALLLLAALVWAFFHPTMGVRTRRGLSVALLVALLGWLFSAMATMQPVAHNAAPDAPTPQAAAQAASHDPSRPHLVWQPWSQAQQQQLLAAGRTVFVDYTAAWCITCQYNKRTVLADAAVLADFAAHDVALLRADWTLKDAAITAELTQLGRTGVPTYVVLRPNAPPHLLPELPSAADIHRALNAPAQP